MKESWGCVYWKSCWIFHALLHPSLEHHATLMPTQVNFNFKKFRYSKLAPDQRSFLLKPTEPVYPACFMKTKQGYWEAVIIEIFSFEIHFSIWWIDFLWGFYFNNSSISFYLIVLIDVWWKLNFKYWHVVPVCFRLFWDVS